jgi:hypothetical protein
VEWDEQTRVITITALPPREPQDFWLMPYNEVAYKIMNDFYNSVRVEGNTAIGTVPTVPKGYQIVFNYRDTSDGQWGNQQYDVIDINKKYKAGQTFKIPYYGKGGYFILGVFKGDPGLGDIRIEVPSLDARWGMVRP